MRTHCHRITCAALLAAPRRAAPRCAALRPLRQSDHANCLTRVLCPTCESDRKLFPSEANPDCDCSVPISDTKSRWVGGLSAEITYCSAQGVTRYALSSPYGQSQRYALGLRLQTIIPRNWYGFVLWLLQLLQKASCRKHSYRENTHLAA